MSFLLRQIARYAAQTLASDPRAREKAAKVARGVVDEASISPARKTRPRPPGGFSVAPLISFRATNRIPHRSLVPSVIEDD